MKIIEKKLDDLRPYENNPRNNAAAVEPVMHSIQQFGFKVPLVIDKDGTIVTGHTRLLAAKGLGMEKVPCIVADDLTEDQVNAFRLADNKVAESSSWDWSKLEEELARMEIAEIDMTEFGFPADDGIDSFFQNDSQNDSEKKPSAKESQEETFIRIRVHDAEDQQQVEDFCEKNNLEYEVVGHGHS